jgi:hypothetical protein
MLPVNHRLFGALEYRMIQPVRRTARQVAEGRAIRIYVSLDDGVSWTETRMFDSQDELPLNLGEVARRLKNALGLPARSATRRLKVLQLLRTGALKGFVAIPATPELRVTVPERFWQGVDMARLNSIRSVTNNEDLIGAFTLQLPEIAGAVADALRARHDDEHQATAITNVIKFADRDLEVWVLSSELDSWVLAQGKEVQEQFQSREGTKRGRRLHQGWPAVWQAFTVVLLNHIHSPGSTLPKGDALYDDVRKAAQNAGATKIPKADTIRKEVAKLMDRKLS